MADAAATPPPLSLRVGDRVVYPNQGVCRVSGVEAKEVAGQTLTFVTMRREEDGAVVMVPESKVRAIGLRKVANADEVKGIFAFLRSDSDKADLDWKQRARSNLERMSAGGLLGLAEVVKGLQVLSELRPLPAKERELYDNARHLLVAEITASLGVTECNAEDSVDLILFPPGRERPKRTADEFAKAGSGDDDLGDLDDELMSLGGDLDLPREEEPAEEAPEASESDEDEAPKESAAKPKAAKGKKLAPITNEDDEPTEGMGKPLSEDEDEEPKKKRGRPPKPKPAVAVPPPPPKKRGRPPKPKVVQPAPATPKKRGRPPKAR